MSSDQLNTKNNPLAIGMLTALTLSYCLVAPAWAGGKTTSTSAAYSYSVLGKKYYDSNLDRTTEPMPTAIANSTSPLVLMGGGPDVDEAYRWMIKKAGITTTSGGRFVVIRTTGTDAYNPYFYYSNASNSTSAAPVDGYVGGASLGLTSAETLIITTRAAANDLKVAKIIETANALWIAGGDQSTYVNLWGADSYGNKTEVGKAIETLISKNVPVGGTSAGANVLGHFVFTAAAGTVTSTQAQSNPYNKYIDTELNLFSLNAATYQNNSPIETATLNTFVDPHFKERDRMGRLVTFVSRSTTGCTDTSIAGVKTGVLTPASSARGIGIEVESALLIEGQSAQLVTNTSNASESAAYFLKPSVLPGSCKARTALTMNTVGVNKIAIPAFSDNTIAYHGPSFDLSKWTTASPQYSVDVNNGSLSWSNGTGSPY